MKGKFQIISERLESFTGKKGKVVQHILALLDLDPEPLINTVDYVLSEDEQTKYSGKTQGKRIELAIHAVLPAYGGRLRLQGVILSLA